MKRIITLLALICLLCCLVGCMHDPYKEKRPQDYGDARWVCSSPDVYFDIHSNPSADELHSILGLLSHGGQDTKIYLKFERVDGGDGVYFMNESYETDPLFYGVCEFSPEKMVVKIVPKEDKFFEGKVEELVFVRTELPTSTE